MTRTISKISSSIWNRTFCDFLSKHFEGRWFSVSDLLQINFSPFMIVWSIEGKGRAWVLFWNYIISIFLRTNSRSMCYFHRFCNHLWFVNQLPSRTLFTRPSRWFFFLCYLFPSKPKNLSLVQFSFS